MANPADEGPCGRLAWELVDLTSGLVHPGARSLHPTDFEVVVSPKPAAPQLRGLRHPGRVVADAAGWLLTGGHGVTTKRLQLTDGFWLVLRELRASAQPSLVHLTAVREHPRLTCVTSFRLDADDGTATRVTESGSLQVRWGRDPDGMSELVDTTVLTDTSLALRAERRSAGRPPPEWHVRLLAGSQIRWPRSGDGLRLVPRLRPDLGR